MPTKKGQGATSIFRQSLFPQQQKLAGLLVTDELEKALLECKTRVERIARDCRAQNRRFRDIEFDLENDKDRCLFGLSTENRRFKPSDVQRVHQIFPAPSFYIDGAHSGDIVQGRMGDCWVLSALSTASTAEGLVERFCVARDERVGVYGFVFFRDTRWVVVIIDDLLYTAIPKFEELNNAEQTLYHNDKKLYETSARKGGKTLYFARSGTENETWVPLVEKAYAKLHGDYLSIDGGFSCDAIEDLTGGVSTLFRTKDILDTDIFWKDELLYATRDRLFGCGFDGLDTARRMAADDEAVGLTVNGLIGAHAYSVLRAVEYNGKRFVVLRNPWGDSEWTGAWSDGSKEWTEEWLPALKALGHSFGEDGQFVMEYSDFLENWSVVERTLVFDDTWVMSSQWLQVTAREPTSAWSFGDISFTISIPSATRAVIVLSKLEERYFTEMSGNSIWMFDFVVFKKGSKEMLAQSSIPRFHLRSVNVELWLQRGDYVVHVRLDRQVVNKLTVYTADNADSRKLARVRAERAISQSIASNFKQSTVLDNLPIPLEVLAGQDLTQLEVKAAEAEAALRTHEQGPVREKKSFSLSNTTGFPPTGLYKREMTMKAAPATAEAEDDDGDENWADDEEVDADPTLDAPLSLADEDLGVDQEEDTGPGADAEEHGGARREDEGLSEYSNDTVVLGLKVYTKKNAPATVQGQLRHEMDVSYAAFVSVALE